MKIRNRRTNFILMIILASTIMWIGLSISSCTNKNINYIKNPIVAADASIMFEMNKGQTSDEVHFLARGSGFTLFLTKKGATLVVAPQTDNMEDKKNIPDAKHHHHHEDLMIAPNVLHMDFLNANKQPKISGINLQKGTSNYIIGQNQKKWFKQIPLYQKVEYKDVYPGIDLIFYSNNRRLEFDFIVHTGGRPEVIKLDFNNLNHLALTSSGDMHLHIGTSEMTLRAPKIFQEKNGVKHPIDGQYTISNKKQVGFKIASYDRSKPLIIDPVLVYSTLLGGTQYDEGRGIIVDTGGNAYICGNTPSTDFPTTTGCLQNAHAGNGDIYVTKFNPQGSDIIFSTYIGGGQYEWSHDIALDEYGNTYVTGYTQSHDFPTTSGAFQTVKGGGTSTMEDAFIVKLNSTGTALVYSTFLGGNTGTDRGLGICLDSGRNAYVTGVTHSYGVPPGCLVPAPPAAPNCFPTTPNAFQGTSSGNGDVFITKLNAAGSALVYSTLVGGALLEEGYAIALDSNNNACVSGPTSSSNYPVTSGVFQTTLNGAQADVFITKVNSDGSDLIFSTYVGGTGYDWGHGIAVDSQSNVYTTGYTHSTDFPTQNPYQAANGGNKDAFIVKLNSTGTSMVYGTYLGGSQGDEGHSILVDTTGNMYIGGLTWSSDFPTARPIQNQICQGCPNITSSDAFIAQFNPTGSNLLFSTYLGGIVYDWAHEIALGTDGAIYIVGDTSSTDFPLTSNAYQQTHLNQDAYVSKILLQKAVMAPIYNLLLLQ